MAKKKKRRMANLEARFDQLLEILSSDADRQRHRQEDQEPPIIVLRPIVVQISYAEYLRVFDMMTRLANHQPADRQPRPVPADSESRRNSVREEENVPVG